MKEIDILDFLALIAIVLLLLLARNGYHLWLVSQGNTFVFISTHSPIL